VEIENGFSVPNEHNMKFLVKQLVLVTQTHTITVENKCESLRYDCPKMSYIGVNNKTDASISLSGSPFYGKRLYENGVRNTHMLGYYFRNGDIEYFVNLNGSLKIYDTKQKSVLLELQGKWIEKS